MKQKAHIVCMYFYVYNHYLHVVYIDVLFFYVHRFLDIFSLCWFVQFQLTNVDTLVKFNDS